MNKSVTFAHGRLQLDVGHIARLTLQNPDALNAMSHGMWLGFKEAIEYVSLQKEVRVLILTGQGDRAFSAGADITEFPITYESEITTSAYNNAVRNAQDALAKLSVPTIAEIRGICFGGGCGLALHCDLRFVTTSSRFAITPARLGLAYSFQDTARLVSLVGPAFAKDILMSGRVIEAQEALNIGLVNRVVEKDKLNSVVSKYAAYLGAMSKTSISIAKETIESISRGDISPSPELKSAFDATFSGSDFAEGYAAFLEKRSPKFQ